MKRLVILLIVFMSMSTFVFGQATATHDVTINIVEVEMIALDDATVVTLTTNAPAAAGDVVAGDDSAADPRILSYTVLTSADKKITVDIVSNDVTPGTLLPAGTSLDVDSTTAVAYGNDQGTITLSGVAQDLILDIQSCHTGIGTGATIVYTLNIDDDTLLVAGDSQTVTVTYTLTDE